MNKKTAGKQRRSLITQAVSSAFIKLDPRRMVRNPVMFIVEVGSLLTSILWIQSLTGKGEAVPWFIGAITLWLWFTVLFTNFSEAHAEGRGKAQAEALRRTRQETRARQLSSPQRQASTEMVSSSDLRQGNGILVETGEMIPADGEIEGERKGVMKTAIHINQVEEAQ